MPTPNHDILLIGSTGQVGGELLREAPQHHRIHASDRSIVDLNRPDQVADAVVRLRPTLIINAGGYTAVDRAEAEPETARRINVESVGMLARAARQVGATLIHYSTDYVFDGCKQSAYLPTDTPNPRSVYARTKLEGELAVQAAGGAHAVIRTQWVYGLRGRNFVRAILGQACLRRELRIVSDQVGCPTWARTIARVTWHMIGHGLDNRQGIHHLACRGAANWFEFAQAVFEELKRHSPEFPVPMITPITTAEYGAPASRPAHAVLDCSATEEAFGMQLPHWREALSEALRDTAALQSILAAELPALR